ncbi:MAG: hypothetical protein ACOVRN_01310 [Flavobacterium sp.]
MDDPILKQKIPVIIKEHILQTKIGYVIDILLNEKRKCKPIAIDMEKGMERGSSVFVKHSAKDEQGESKFTPGKTIEISISANGVVR